MSASLLKKSVLATCMCMMLADTLHARRFSADEVVKEILGAPLPFGPKWPTATWFFTEFAVVPKGQFEYEIVKSALPTTAVWDKYSFPNCSDSEISETHSFRLEYEEVVTVRLDQSYAVSEQATATFEVKYNVLEAGLSRQSTVTASVNQEKNSAIRQTKVYTEERTIKVPPKTELTVVLSRFLSNDHVKFKGSGVVDARLKIKNGPHAPIDLPYRGVGTKTYLSDIVPDEGKRTRPISGEIWNVEGRSTEYKYIDRPLKDDDQKCLSP